MPSIHSRLRGGAATIATLGALVGLLILPLGATASTYPAGGGTFSGSAQGWVATDEHCDLLGTSETGLLCNANGEYDSEHGNPAGSLAAKTTVVVNLATLFESGVTFQSPEFTVAESGTMTLHVDRQFEPGELIALEPKATYEATLVDQTSGTESKVVEEAIGSSPSAFAGKDGVVTVTGGHAYAIRIVVTVTSTAKVAAGGTGSVRFDNVSLTPSSTSGDDGGGGKGGDGNNGGNGGSGVGLTDAKLFSLLSAGGNSSPAVLKGKRLLVKVGCPRTVGHACRITAQGLLNKRKPATTKRTVKVAKGKSKRVVLRVKPKARRQIAKRKRLLVREKVRAGAAKATVYRQRKLIRH